LSDFNEKLNSFLPIHVKYSNNKFHENFFGGSRVVSCGRTDEQTDRHDESNGRFAQFCERV